MIVVIPIILCNDNTINECIQNDEYSYIETRIINECLQMNDAHYLIWQCYDKYYIGLIYNNINRNHLVETYKFEYGECVDGLIQYGSCDYVNIGGTNIIIKISFINLNVWKQALKMV